MIVILMILHLIAALFVLVLWTRGRLTVSPVLVLVCFLLPLWGPLCVFAVQMHVLGGEKAEQEAEGSRFGITDEVYRNIHMDKSGVEEVLPIEDVLMSGSPRQRRSLLLSVLHSGPGDFVRPLRIAGVNDDTEVVHYAVTALVELRSEYSQRITEMEEKILREPSSPRLLLACADLDEEYLKTGIPENAERLELISRCRDKLERLLHALEWEKTARGGAGSGRGKMPDKSEILRRIAQMCLLQGDAEASDHYTDLLRREDPDSGEFCLLRIRARALARDGRGIEKLIRDAAERNVYFSPKQREELGFWETDKQAGSMGE